MDLRWWADRVRMGWEPRMPTRRTLEASWGWSARQVTKLVVNEGRWVDPLHADQGRSGDGPVAGQGRTKRGASKGKKSQGVIETRTGAESKPDADRTRVPRARSTRADTDHRSPHRSNSPLGPPEGDLQRAIREGLAELEQDHAAECAALPSAEPLRVDGPTPGLDEVSLADLGSAMEPEVSREEWAVCTCGAEISRGAQAWVILLPSVHQLPLIGRQLGPMRWALGAGFEVQAREGVTPPTSPLRRLREGEPAAWAELRQRVACLLGYGPVRKQPAPSSGRCTARCDPAIPRNILDMPSESRSHLACASTAGLD